MRRCSKLERASLTHQQCIPPLIQSQSPRYPAEPPNMHHDRSLAPRLPDFTWPALLQEKSISRSIPLSLFQRPDDLSLAFSFAESRNLHRLGPLHCTTAHPLCPLLSTRPLRPSPGSNHGRPTSETNNAGRPAAPWEADDKRRWDLDVARCSSRPRGLRPPFFLLIRRYRVLFRHCTRSFPTITPSDTTTLPPQSKDARAIGSPVLPKS